jgi:cobalt-zinc-cadmium efflux system protein
MLTLENNLPPQKANVVLEGEVSLHEAQQRGEELKTLLARTHGIAHATLELECHACEDDQH